MLGIKTFIKVGSRSDSESNMHWRLSRYNRSCQIWWNIYALRSERRSRGGRLWISWFPHKSCAGKQCKVLCGYHCIFRQVLPEHEQYDSFAGHVPKNFRVIKGIARASCIELRNGIINSTYSLQQHGTHRRLHLRSCIKPNSLGQGYR